MKVGIIMLVFLTGLLGGVCSLFPEYLADSAFSTYSLYVLMFLVGMSIGADKTSIDILKNIKLEIIAVPLAVIVGTLAGTALFSLFLKNLSLKDSLAVGAGMGYYSLSSIIISEIRGDTLGSLALLSNVMREVATLLFSPFLALVFGKLAPIASGGATSMDSTLPVIRKVSGKEYVLIAIFSGTVLTLLVPVLVMVILELF